MATNVTNMAKAPELRKRIFFTLAMLAIYRIGIIISVSGINHEKLKESIANFGSSAKSFLNLFSVFSGGGLEQVSIFALGVMPYISASIILQILGVVVPAIEQLQKEGEQGRKKINQYTRYGAILLSLVQGFFVASWLNGAPDTAIHPGLGFIVMTMLALTTGTAFLMWLGEQITERGIGNGTSLIIFSGIVARFPTEIAQLFQKSVSGELTLFQLLLIGTVIVLVIAAVIFCERGYRKIPIEYAKRMIGNKQYGGQSSHIPLKINVAGVIPPIFASALLLFPGQIASFLKISWLKTVTDFLDPKGVPYNVFYILLIIFFCYFYAAITFNPADIAENLKKNGGFIPGIRPGKKTIEYIDQVLSRLTLGGALYISAVCVLPVFLQSQFAVTFYFGGTSLLIVVGVALDTVQQIQQHMVSHNYEQGVSLGGSRNRSIRLR